MKKIFKLFFIVFLCVLYCNVYASGISFEFVFKNDKWNLKIKDEHDSYISYKTAMKEYNLDPCLKLYKDDAELYFYLGEEITKEKYDEKMATIDAKKKAESYKDKGIFIKDTDDALKYIKNIYSGKLKGEYHLVYANSTVDLKRIKDYITNNYLSNLNKNIYTYPEYGITHPMKFLPIITDDEMTISSYNIKISEDEKRQLDEFASQYKRLFKNKSDYEKVLTTYNYIKKTTKAPTDKVYEDSIKAKISAYDALIKQSAVCIGTSTAFTYLLDQLDVKSYIVDHVEYIDEEKHNYVTTHTYNIVKLDGKWYIIDMQEEDLEGFLLGKNSKIYAEEDFKNNNIKINDESYIIKESDTSIDYDYLKDTITRITKKQATIEKKEKITASKDTLYYVVLSIILIIIALIIGIFTSKKNNKK